jgi:NADPH2:quinone reductase
VLLKGVILRGFEGRSIGRHAPDAALARLVADGMRPLVSRVQPLDEVAAALSDVAGRRTTGKVVLEMAAA